MANKPKEEMWDTWLHLTASPGVQLHICSCTWVVGRRGITKTRKRVGVGVRKEEGLTPPKRTEPATPGEPQKARNPGNNSCDRAWWAKEANLLQAWDTSRTVVVLSSGDPLH